MNKPGDKSNEQWRAELSDEAYRVTRGKGTEAAFSGKYCDSKAAGTYRCICCGEALFSSKTKFDSGSGWPSFTAPTSEAAISTEADTTRGMVRTEVVCRSCDAHLGHVFPDGPTDAGGLRFCINSCALDLDESSDD